MSVVIRPGCPGRWRAPIAATDRRQRRLLPPQTPPRPSAIGASADPARLLQQQDPSQLVDVPFNAAVPPAEAPVADAVVEEPAVVAAEPVAAEVESPTAVPVDGMVVKISIQYRVTFGDNIKLVGSGPALGDWDPSRALVMTWGEGDVWSAAAELPPGGYEFKVGTHRHW